MILPSASLAAAPVAHDVVSAAEAAVAAGAAGVKLRIAAPVSHAIADDARRLANLRRGRTLDIEGAAVRELLDLAGEIAPDQVTLAPGAGITAWRMAWDSGRLREAIARLRPRVRRIVLAVDLDPSAPAVARALGADAVRFEVPKTLSEETLDRCRRMVAVATDVGVALHAGQNGAPAGLKRLLAAVPALAEATVGGAADVAAPRAGWLGRVRVDVTPSSPGEDNPHDDLVRGLSRRRGAWTGI